MQQLKKAESARKKGFKQVYAVLRKAKAERRKVVCEEATALNKAMKENLHAIELGEVRRAELNHGGQMAYEGYPQSSPGQVSNSKGNPRAKQRRGAFQDLVGAVGCCSAV